MKSRAFMMGRTDAWQINCVPVARPHTSYLHLVCRVQAGTINCSLHFEFLVHIRSRALHQNRRRGTQTLFAVWRMAKWNEVNCLLPCVGRIDSNLFHSSLATASNDCIASGVAVAATSSSFCVSLLSVAPRRCCNEMKWNETRWWRRRRGQKQKKHFFKMK